MKAVRKKRQRAKRTKTGDPTVQLLADFLSLDMKRAVLQIRQGGWHKYQLWPSLGIPANVSADDRQRYEQLKPVIVLLEERHVYPHSCPDLLDRLTKLQDEAKTRLRPLFEQGCPRIGGMMRELLTELNTRVFRAQWALYSLGEIHKNSLHHSPTCWWCTYNPEKPDHVTEADPAWFINQKRLKIGDYQYVVKEVFPRTASAAPGDDVISDRLYWIIGQTLINATIGTLRICAECKKYFAAHDSKQVCCDHACYLVKNGQGKSDRAKQSKRKAREIKMFGRFRDSINDDPSVNHLIQSLGGPAVVRGWGTKTDREVWKGLTKTKRKMISAAMSGARHVDD